MVEWNVVSFLPTPLQLEVFIWPWMRQDLAAVAHGMELHVDGCRFST